MNGKTLALCVLSSVYIFSLNANTRGFAPYDKERGFSLDSRFEGNFSMDKGSYVKKAFALDINGYYKGESGWFGKLGVSTFIHSDIRHIPLPNLQVGKYWKGIGALRFGLFNGFPLIGGDYWVMYDRFKWLTTLEPLIFITKGCPGVGVTWLNRFFLTDELYVSTGINYVGLLTCSDALFYPYVSIGLGFAF